jgi:hypothetical protein
MSFQIPQSVFDKYNEVVDYMINEAFGVICQLVSIEKVETIVSNPETNNIPQRNSINAHRKRSNGGYDRGIVTVTEKEVLTEVKLRCYFDKKSWNGIKDSNIVVPDADLETIGFMSDMPELMRAKEMIVHKGIKDYKEQRYVRVGDPMPWAFKKNRYVICYWKLV